MDSEARKAEFEEALARSRVVLDPEACRAAIAEEAAQARVHRDDGYSCDWAVGMPKAEPPPLPPRTLTDAEIVQIVRDEIAKQPRAPTTAETEALVERVLGKHLVLTPKAIVPILHELRQQLRGEMKAHTSRPAEEFFYTDDDGQKQDAELHNAIINPVDFPIDEKIMAPIRARNRAKWLAERKARRA